MSTPRILTALAAAALAGCLFLGLPTPTLEAVAQVPAAEDGPVVEGKAFMEMKLKYMNQVLDGLSRDNFDDMAQGAESLFQLSHQSAWQAFQSPDYHAHSADFRRACKSLVKHARAKDSAAVTLDYVLLTTRCVDCHRFVRDGKPAK